MLYMKSKYKQIFEHYSALIEGEKLRPGESLPPEREIMEEFGVSRDTVRKAMQLLEQNKYISKKRGRESIVRAEGRFDFPIARILSFTEMARQLQWDNVITGVEDLSIIEADEELELKMDAEPGEEIYRVIRTREIDGEKIILDIDYFKKRYVPRLTKDICAGSIYDYLEKELGLKIGIAQKIVTVEEATKQDKMYMDLKGGGVVAVVTSVTALETGEIFQHTISRHRVDKFRFVETAKRQYVSDGKN